VEELNSHSTPGILCSTNEWLYRHATTSTCLSLIYCL